MVLVGLAGGATVQLCLHGNGLDGLDGLKWLIAGQTPTGAPNCVPQGRATNSALFPFSSLFRVLPMVVHIRYQS
jgi:hypothetical protein